MKNMISVVGVVMVGGAAWGAEDEAESTPQASPYAVVDRYRQELVVQTVPDRREIGRPDIAPVFDGHKWALSTRWDDSNPNAVNIRRKMLETGIRGTFYLNSKRPEKRAETSLAYQLSGNGECSIGGHSVSHPSLPKLPVNEAFRELMANRITLEVLTDRPVNSLAFPYGAYRDKERPEVMQAITEAVLRSGYHHCVYKGFVVHNPHLPNGLVSTGHQVVPGDREVNEEKFWASIEKIRKYEARYQEASHGIFLGVHPWQKGQALEDLGRVMGKLHDWDDFWHCTQTEFAAYVKQRRNTTVTPMGEGRFSIERPCAYDLGSDVALTLVFEGTVRSATVNGTPCAVRETGNRTIVNVPHAPEHGLPVLIDETVSGASTKFPGLEASLVLDDGEGQVRYTLVNASGAAVTDVVLTLSVPPALEPGMFRRQCRQLGASETWSLALPVQPGHSEEYWCTGDRYFAAQLDFVLRGTRGRLFTSSLLPPAVAVK